MSDTRKMKWTRRATFVTLAGLSLACQPETTSSPGVVREASVADVNVDLTAWSVALNLESAWPGAHPDFNLPTSADGCPLTSRDGKQFFIATDRPDETGSRDLDIWVASRDGASDPWGAPVKLPAPINSDAADFCPMLARDGHTFYFVSARAGGCGGTDIYVTRFRGDGSIDEPRNLGCDVNSAADEAGPVPVNEPGRGPVLYFSSTRLGGFDQELPGETGDSDLYVTEMHGNEYQSPSLVPVVNTAAADGQPYIRDDALELFFYSNRAGALGGNDIYVATRESTREPWSTPENLGANINTGSSETRPSLSTDGLTLYFGSTRAGSNDVYAATRQRVKRGN